MSIVHYVVFNLIKNSQFLGKILGSTYILNLARFLAQPAGPSHPEGPAQDGEPLAAEGVPRLHRPRRLPRRILPHLHAHPRKSTTMMNKIT